MLAAVLGPALQGCAGPDVLASAGAVAGTSALEERGVKGVISDTDIRLRINALWSSADERMWRKVGLQVHGGRVLLTGFVDDTRMSDEAVRLAWEAKGVKEVINELRISKSTGGFGFAADSLISAELKSRILFDGRVRSANYSIETVGNVVYILGIAQSRAELDRVLDHAEGISAAKKVVHHVRIKAPAEAS